MFEEVAYGSLPQAQLYRKTLNAIQQLTCTDALVGNYRPQILVLSGLPSHRPALIDFAQLICRNNSLMFCTNIIEVFRFF